MSAKTLRIRLLEGIAALLLVLPAPAANATEPYGHPFESEYTLHSLTPDALGAWAAGAPFLDAHDSLGTKISRTMVRWAETEFVYDDDNFHFASTDSSILPVLEAGLTVFLTLRNRHPDFVKCPPDTYPEADGPPVDMYEYQKWVEAVVKHYYPKGIRHFQVGNEVWDISGGDYINKFWCSDLADYEDLFLTAGKAIRTASDSAAIVVPAGFASNLYVNWSWDSNGGLGLKMLADHPHDWDMLDLHLYRKTSNVDDTVIWIQNLLENAGLGDKLLISSECGGPDLRDDLYYSDSLHSQQVIQRPCMVLGEGFDQMILWHIKTDTKVHKIFQIMSLIEDDNREWVTKPAFHAYDTFLDFVDGATAVQRVKISDLYDQTYLYRWDNTEVTNSIAIAWSWAGEGVGEIVELPPPCRYQPYYGMYGDSLGVTDLLMYLNTNPVFIPWVADNSALPPGTGRTRPALANFPNPFSPRTRIRYELADAGHARLAVYDPAGRRLRILLDDALPAGTGEISWDGRDEKGRPLATGIYLLKLEAGGEAVEWKLVLLK